MAVSSEARPVAGKKLFIGNAAMTPASNLTSSSFTSVTWTQIKGWETQGKLTKARNTMTIALIDDGQDQVISGSKTAEATENSFIKLNGDAGQAAARAAWDAGVNYPFKVEGNEAGASTVSQKLFVGIITDVSEIGGSANNPDMMSVSIARNSNLVDVAAA